MSKGVFDYTDFKNDYCELRSSAQRLPFASTRLPRSSRLLWIYTAGLDGGREM